MAGNQTLSGRGLVEFQAKTANYTVLAEENGTGFTNTGASGAITFALPAATAGLHYYFAVAAAQELRIDPNGTETISLPSDGVPGAAGAYLTANAIGETVHLMCATTGSWRVMGYTGTWTAV
jgi:hypothetical protein